MSARKEYELMFALRANMDSSLQQTFQKSGGMIQELQNKVNEAKKAMRDIEAYQKLGEAIENNTAKMARQKKAYEDEAATLENQKKKQSEYTEKLIEAQKQQQLEEMRLKSLQQQYDKTTKPTEKLTKALEKQKEAYEKAKAATETAQKKFDNEAAAIQNTTARLQKKEAALGKTTNAMEQNKIALEKQGTALRDAGVDTDNLTEALDRQKKSYEELRDAQESVGATQRKLQENSAALSSAKATFMSNLYFARMVGSAAYKYGVSPSAEFNAQMSRVQAISGASAAETAELKDVARKSGLTTRYTATESAEALEYMALAGWTPEKMKEGLGGIVSLAAAGNSEIGTTSDIVTDALTAFKLKASESNHLADIMAATMANSNTDIEKMGESFKYAAPLAGAYNFSPEDTAFLIGLEANAGIKGRMGGTSLRTVFTKFANDITLQDANGDDITVKTSDANGKMRGLKEITDDLRAAFKGMEAESKDAINSNLISTAKELGISLTDDNGAAKTSAELFGEISDELDNMTEAGKVSEAEAIGGKTAMAGLLAIMNASEDEYERLADAIYNCDGAADKMAKTMLDNLQGDITIAKSAAEGFGITLGDIVTPNLRSMVQIGTKALQGMADFTDRNPWVVKALAGTTAGVIGTNLAISGLKLASFGLKRPVLIAKNAVETWNKANKYLNGSLKSVNGSTKLVAQGIGFLTTPVGATVGVITALAAAGFVCYNIYQKNREEWRKFGETVREAYDKMEDSRAAADEVTKLKDRYKELGDAINGGALSADELKQAQDERKEIEQWFIDKYPEFCSAEDAKRDAMDKSIDKVEEYTTALKNLDEAEFETKYAELKANEQGYLDDIKKLQGKIDEWEAERKNALNDATALYNIAAVLRNPKFTNDEKANKMTEFAGNLKNENLREHYSTNSAKLVKEGNIDKLADSIQETADYYMNHANLGKEKIEEWTDEMKSTKNSIKELDEMSDLKIEKKLGMTYEEATNLSEALRLAKEEIKNGGKISENNLDIIKKFYPEIENAKDETEALTKAEAAYNVKLQEAEKYAEDEGISLNNAAEREKDFYNYNHAEDFSFVASVLEKIQSGAALSNEELQKLEILIPGIGAQADKLTPLEEFCGTLKSDAAEAVKYSIIFENMWDEEAKKKTKYNEIKSNFDIVKNALEKVKTGTALTKDEVKKLEEIIPGIGSADNQQKIELLETAVGDLAIKLYEAANKAQELTNKINGVPTQKTFYLDYVERTTNNSKINSLFPSLVPKGIEHNALGTDYSADAFVAGENGPELITKAKGSKVFTAIETGRIFRNINALREINSPPKISAPYVDERALLSGDKTEIKIEYSPTINGGDTQDIEKILASERNKLVAQVVKALDERDADRRRRAFA